MFKKGYFLMVAQNEQPVSTTPRLPIAELRDVIDDTSERLAKALRAYALAEPAPGDTRSTGERLLYGEQLAFEILLDFLAVTHAQLDDVHGPEGMNPAERKHDVHFELLIGHFLPRTLTLCADAALIEGLNPTEAVFADIEVITQRAMDDGMTVLGGIND